MPIPGPILYTINARIGPVTRAFGPRESGTWIEPLELRAVPNEPYVAGELETHRPVVRIGPAALF